VLNTIQSQALPQSETKAHRARAPQQDGVVALAEVPLHAWHALAAQSIEPNGYYLPDWARTVTAYASGRTGFKALMAWQPPRPGGTERALAALVPVVSAWRAFRLPLPVFVSAEAYGALGTPLIATDGAEASVARLLQQARASGGHALVLRDVPLEGPVMRTIDHVLGWTGQRARVIGAHDRAVLHANKPGEDVLRDALGPKKLKELRRQRNRLSDHGEVRFASARTAPDVARALDTFLALEASGWKGRRGTALANDEGDVAFIRRACAALAAQDKCEIVTLSAGDMPVASGIVLRHRDRAFFFKIAVDETFARLSPGVQLTLELTQALCADDTITLADSTAIPGHPMIGPLWRGRMRTGDVVIPLSRNNPVPALVAAALRARGAFRQFLRPLVNYLRSLKDKEP
jgi:CelD/BcsL family acetyltransferase involved in cellulose biosynthesis